MKSKEINELVEEKGYLHLVVLFEVVGNPKEHIVAMIKRVMDGVKGNKDIKVFKEDYGDPEEAGEGLWGTFCESEMLIKDFNLLSWIAFNFSPASIEVKAPKEMVITDKELSTFSGELLSQLHQNNLNTVRANSEKKETLLNFNKLARNTILLSLKDGEKSPEEVSRDIGIDADSVTKLLEAMIKEKTVAKSGEKYVRIK